MSPTKDDLWFLPLGGCGEIGMNMNLYAHDHQWLIVDCGITFKRLFSENADPGVLPPMTIEMPDPSFISSRRKQLAGLVVTHAHEDHIGAVHHLWEQLRCPVYCTAFTARVLHRKLCEKGIADKVTVNIVNVGDRVQIGAFNVEWLSITHSIPEPTALIIDTPVGSVFHTADWKIDSNPVIGQHFNEQRFKALRSRNITAMVCDSTNALIPGYSQSEGSLFAGLKHAIEDAPGRVIVSSFSSNVARMQTLANVARATERYIALLGRSLDNMAAHARACDYLGEKFQPIQAADLGYLPPREVLALATGSQGEPRTALQRLAYDNHRDLKLEARDRVIFSSRVIPGNEHAVNRLIDKFHSNGVEVITATEAKLPIHASGHPCEEELKQLYFWVKPQIAIPVHGEQEHILANAALAKSQGIKRQMTGANGDLFMLSPNKGLRRNFANSGRIRLERT